MTRSGRRSRKVSERSGHDPKLRKMPSNKPHRSRLQPAVEAAVRSAAVPRARGHPKAAVRPEKTRRAGLPAALGGCVFGGQPGAAQRRWLPARALSLEALGPWHRRAALGGAGRVCLTSQSRLGKRFGPFPRKLVEQVPMSFCPRPQWVSVTPSARSLCAEKIRASRRGVYEIRRSEPPADDRFQRPLVAIQALAGGDAATL